MGPLAGDGRDRSSRRALESPREAANGSLFTGRFRRTLTDNARTWAESILSVSPLFSSLGASDW